MKGATPSGPRVLITINATPTQAPCATTGSRWNDTARLLAAVGRTYWPAIPTAIARTTDVVTSGEGRPHASKSLWRIWPARWNESAREKNQPKETTYNGRQRP